MNQGFSVRFRTFYGTGIPGPCRSSRSAWSWVQAAWSRRKMAGILWRFQDAEQAWSIVLGRDFFGVETQRYTQFEDLRDRLTEILPVVTTLGINWRERLGLRYVNQMHHPSGRTPAAWRELLNPMFLGMVGGDELGVGCHPCDPGDQAS